MGTVERLERIYRYEQSCEFLPHRLKSLALSLPDKQKERVEELRLRVMHPLTVLTLEGELNAAPDGRGGMFFLRGSLTASAFLLFLYVGSLYLTEIRPLQELGTNFANVLGAVTKAKEILDIPVYQGGSDFPENHDIELRNVRFSYDGKTDRLLAK